MMRMWVHGGEGVVLAVVVVCSALLAAAHPQIGQHVEEAESSTDAVFECYARYMRTTFEYGVLVLHKNKTNVARYVASIRSPYTIYKVSPEVERDLWKHALRWPFDLVVLLVARPIELSGYKDMLRSWIVYHPQIRILVVGVTREFDAEPHGIFRLIKLNHLLNVAVLAWNNTRVHTNFPYGGGACHDWTHVEELGPCQRLSLEQVYPDKLPKQFNGCAMQTAVKMPAPAVIDPKSDSEKSFVAGYQIALSNIILRQLNLTKDQTKDSPVAGRCRNVYLFYTDTATWYVPVAAPRAQWQSVVFVFQAPLWAAVLAFFLLNTLVWWLVAAGAASYVQCMLGSLLTLLNGSVPLPRSEPLRFVVVSWTLCSLVLVAAYQSQLLSVLLTPVAGEQHITNQDELLASDMPLDLKWTRTELVRIHDFRKVLPHYKKFRFDSSMPRAVLQYTLMAKYRAREQRDVRGNPTLFAFKQPSLYLPLCVQLDWRSPILHSVNRIVPWLVENGIVAKLLRDVDFSGYVTTGERENEPLTMHHLDFVFAVLLLGHAVAILVFLVETLLWRTQHGWWRAFCTAARRCSTRIQVWWRAADITRIRRWRRTFRTRVLAQIPQ